MRDRWLNLVTPFQIGKAGLCFPPLFGTVNSYSSASNKNLRIYRRVDSDTSSKGRLTVRAAGGPCTRFTSFFPPHRFLGARSSKFRHALRERRPRALGPPPEPAAVDALRQLSVDKSTVERHALVLLDWNCQFF